MAQEVKMAEARITKEMIEEMRSKIGLKMRTGAHNITKRLPDWRY